MRSFGQKLVKFCTLTHAAKLVVRMVPVFKLPDRSRESRGGYVPVQELISHLFTELKISPIEMHISPNTPIWRYFQFN